MTALLHFLNNWVATINILVTFLQLKDSLNRLANFFLADLLLKVISQIPSTLSLPNVTGG